MDPRTHAEAARHGVTHDKPIESDARCDRARTPMAMVFRMSAMIRRMTNEIRLGLE